MSDNEYTPTTEVVREAYVFDDGHFRSSAEPMDSADSKQSRSEFDRWLAEHDRQVAAKARAEVIQRLRDTAQQGRSDSTHNAVADWLEREEFPSTPEGDDRG